MLQANATTEMAKKRANWKPACDPDDWCRNVHSLFQQKLFVAATQNAPDSASRYGTPACSSST